MSNVSCWWCNHGQVHLLGPAGDEVKSRRVPLRLVLMYENNHRVHNQEILKLSPDSKLVIDEHGKATLRVRIEEVSKNHQKQVRPRQSQPCAMLGPVTEIFGLNLQQWHVPCGFFVS